MLTCLKRNRDEERVAVMVSEVALAALMDGRVLDFSGFKVVVGRLAGESFSFCPLKKITKKMKIACASEWNGKERKGLEEVASEAQPNKCEDDQEVHGKM